MSSTDSKWKKVPPGHHVPAGQPYAVAYEHHATGCTWSEFVRLHGVILGHLGPNGTQIHNGRAVGYYVDSTWEPPLNLPTEPTPGLLYVRNNNGPLLSTQWHLSSQGDFRRFADAVGWYPHQIIAWIPCTAEQIRKIS